jgi:hypothetical protein
MADPAVGTRTGTDSAASAWEQITAPVRSRLQTWPHLARQPGALVDFDVNLPPEDLSNRVQDVPPSRHPGGIR